MPTKSTPPMVDIHMQALNLAAMLEGLHVLIYEAEGDKSDADARRAANCIGPMSETLAEQANDIATRIEAYLDVTPPAEPA